MWLNPFPHKIIPEYYLDSTTMSLFQKQRHDQPISSSKKIGPILQVLLTLQFNMWWVRCFSFRSRDSWRKSPPCLFLYTPGVLLCLKDNFNWKLRLTRQRAGRQKTYDLRLCWDSEKHNRAKPPNIPAYTNNICTYLKQAPKQNQKVTLTKNNYIHVTAPPFDNAGCVLPNRLVQLARGTQYEKLQIKIKPQHPYSTSY